MIKKEEWTKLEYAVHPGEILKDYLDYENITQKEIVIKTGLKKSFVSEIINGKRPITLQTAIKLEKIFSFEAKFWTNLQMIYNEAIKRLKIKEKEMSSNIFIINNKYTLNQDMAQERTQKMIFNYTCIVETTTSTLSLAA